MTDLDLPLHGPALYNPHLLSKEELLGLFSARQALLQEFLDDLRATPPGESAQHHLILGQRGMGKTMLLRRIQFAVEDDPELSQVWLALSFPEEQYNVAGLSDFWLNCIDALSDTLERLASPDLPETVEKVVEGLDAAVEALRQEPEGERAHHALDVLVSAASTLDRRLLLLVDNADLVLDRIGEQDWSLREVLSSQAVVTFLGASAAAIESTYEYGKAFYDFFRIHHLTGLTVEETQDLLLQYAEAQENEKVARILKEEPGRLRTLHTLTGGNPRTLVLLFNIFVQGPDGDVRSDLEQLLDQCTPLYKARFEALPAQAQQVVDALALHWDPATAGALAETLRMPVNNVSAQLNRLVNQGVVEKVAYEPESKTGFQIAERFFNIWYLMRASRRVRRRLLWLVEFLRMFYSQEELLRRVERHLRLAPKADPRDRLRHAEYSFALASAFEGGRMSGLLERSALQMLVSHEDLRSELRELVDVEGADSGLRDRAEYLQRFEQVRARLDENVKLGRVSISFAEGVLRAPLPLDQKEWIAEKIQNLDDMANLPEIAELVSAQEELEYLAAYDQGIRGVVQAIEIGHMTSFEDVEGAQVAEAVTGSPGLVAVAAANRYMVTDNPENLDVLLGALEDAASPYPWLTWLYGLGSTAAADRLEHGIDRAWELISDNAELLSEFGSILWSRLDRVQEADKAFRKATELDPLNVDAWFNLGGVLQTQSLIAEAIDAFRKAAELRPDDAGIWNSLAGCFRTEGRLKESEGALRKAVDLEPSGVTYLTNLALVLEEQGRCSETEELLRRATQAESAAPRAWVLLGRFLYDQDRDGEAEEVLRRGLEVVGNRAELQNALAWLLFKTNRDVLEAEGLAEQAVSSDSAGPEASHTWACILVRNGKWNKAVQPARRFLSTWVADLPEHLWPDVVSFFREAVTAGRAREAVELLDKQELGERWRPLREALEALALDNPKYLRRVAPEVREPAEAILKELTEPLEERM